ncbi:MurR/RpiR family transcriptional regulator [Rhodococcus opacus]|nr:MurR/RpiR family transcriptional regulator [Rhodococcus opacus]
MRRVADVCVERPYTVARSSTAFVAELAGTSTATVVRACQSLGFSGFLQLKMLLQRDLGAAGAPPNEPSPDFDNANLLHAVFAEMTTDLTRALTPLNEHAFGRAVDALRFADRVLVVGNGGSGAAVAAVATRFSLNDRVAEAPTDVVVQQLTASRLTSRDVCLAVSDSGMDRSTLSPVIAARTAGAQVIGVSSYAHSTLMEHSDIGRVIGGGMGPHGGAAAAVIQIAFLIGLQIAVCQVWGGRAVRCGSGARVALSLLRTPLEGHGAA